MVSLVERQRTRPHRGTSDTRRKMKHEAQIAALTRKLGIGSHASHGVKAILGKMPINMSDSRAESVLSQLQARYDATPEGQSEVESQGAWIEDAPMCAAWANRRSKS